MLAGLDWVILGGESFPEARSFNLEWARDVLGQCRESGVPCFVKQMGANPIDVGHPIALDDLKGGDMAEWPVELQVREWPHQEGRSAA
jgi:protein gp37